MSHPTLSMIQVSIPKYDKTSKNVIMKIIGINALKKKSTCSFAITEGKTNEIPSFAHPINQVKNEAIRLMTHAPILVDNMNPVISNSRTSKVRMAFHLTLLLLGEQR